MPNGLSDLRQIVALGHRLLTAADEESIAGLCLDAIRKSSPSPSAAFVTDRCSRVDGAEWDAAALGTLRDAVIETRQETECRLGELLVLVSPLVARGQVIGAVAAVPSGDPERPRLLLAAIAQHASCYLDLHRSMAAAESRLIAVDRLASVGTLAAGIGHEIANPLASAMLNNSGLAMRLARADLPAGVLADSQRLLDENEEALDRIRSLIADLRTYVRKDDAPPVSLDVRAVIESALRLSRGQLRDLDVSRHLQPVGAVVGSPARLGQVLLNLFVNAAQALRGVPDAKIEVRTEHLGDEIIVTVADNGPGIAPEHLPRIFEVYFTTKEHGQGTGLGLAIARDIVIRHGGRLEVQSEPGCGAAFRVILPAHHPERATLAQGSRAPVSPAVRPARRQHSDADQRPAESGDKPCLLVVDDDVSVLRSLVRRLEAEFDVIPTRSGQEAERALAERSVDVLLCDINLPGENGFDLAARLCASDPRLTRRAVYMTGGTLNDQVRRALAEDPQRVISKPFNLPALVKLLKGIAASS